MSHPTVESSQPLDVVAMPLAGRHLIEASAGTGKTFNITRLYLRLILEKELSVQQILVMTFTNAATEEIRGRIADTLREAAHCWAQALAGEPLADNTDPVFIRLLAQFGEPRHLNAINAALLELDEAAVYTIHGFCNRVLGELAFTSGAAMQLALNTDTRALYLQAAQDWIRQQAKDDAAYQCLMHAGWHTPEALLSTFESAIRSGLEPHLLSAEQIDTQRQEARAALQKAMQNEFIALQSQLDSWQDQITEHLVDNVKDSAVRAQQWHQITQWVCAQALEPLPADFNKFAHHSRFKHCPELKAPLALVRQLGNQLKAALAELEKQHDSMADQAPVLALIAQGFAFIREHVSRQKRQQGVVDFDDLIHLLAARIDAPEAALACQLRHKFPAALIDEFQDTDANQYQILSNVYQAGEESQVLLMIGDPKQAIYGFRGGDIFTYLQAGNSADYRWVMDTNWRSTEPMVSSYNRLFYGAPLDQAPAEVFGFGIGYEPVNATPAAKANKALLNDPHPQRAALTYAGIAQETANSPAKGQLQQQLARWVAGEIVRLLAQAKLGDAQVQPHDIAILVRSGPEALIIQNALRRAGLASVFLSNRTNLFAAPEAQDLYRVLDGIWHYQHSNRLTAALSSPLFGMSHAELTDLLYHENDEAWEAVMNLVLSLRQMWEQRGCMALILYLLEEKFACDDTDIERRLTNYLHLAEVLERESAVQAHAEQLLIWLHRHISQPDQAPEQVQRLESDARLIQLITQHGSKGLEYPIVFVPFASDYRDPARVGKQYQSFYRYYDEQAQQLTLLLGKSDAAIARVRAEGDAESTRLLYVAVTRAAQRCYLGVAGFENQHNSALAKAVGLGKEDSWRSCIEQLSQDAPKHTCYAEVTTDSDEPVVRSSTTAASPVGPLQVDRFDGKVNERWRLYSFSALARRQMVVNRNRREAEIDSLAQGTESDGPQISANAMRFTFTKGAAAGNLLHDIFELSDFSQPDWANQAHAMALRFGIAEDDLGLFFSWLDEVLATPLNQTGITLGGLERKQTLREAEFYFPLASVNLHQLNQFLSHYRKQESAAQGPFMVTLDTQKLEGLMHGFIDLIFVHNDRYYIADYKSTHLGEQFSDYQFAALRRNNQHHLYDLQYLIYAVALHRYLQSKLPDYDPEHHLGGVYYLYLRGMHPANSAQEGVYFARPKTSDLLHLDSLFDMPETE